MKDSTQFEPDAAIQQLLEQQQEQQDLGGIDESQLRRGKWTPEEEKYANKIIDLFDQGTLPIANGTTLRAYLSDKLCCGPMRITKKYAGDSSLGKKVFHWRSEVYTSIELAQLSELQFLESQFHMRLKAKGRKLKSSEFVNAVIDGTAQKMLHQQQKAAVLETAPTKGAFEKVSGGGWSKVMPSSSIDPTSVTATSSSFSSLDGMLPTTMMRVMSAPNLMMQQQLGSDDISGDNVLPGSPRGGLFSSRDKRASDGVGSASSSSSSLAAAARSSMEDYSDYKLEHVSHKFEKERGFHLQNGAHLTSSSSSSSGNNHLAMSPPIRGMSHKTGAGFFPSQHELQMQLGNQLFYSSAANGGMLLTGGAGSSSSTSLQMGMRSAGHISLGQGLKRSRSVSDIERVVELERLAEDDEAAGDLFLDFVSKVARRRPSIVDA